MLYALCDRSSRLARPPGCARIDSRTRYSKNRLRRSRRGPSRPVACSSWEKKTFPHGLAPKRTSHRGSSMLVTHFARKAAIPHRTHPIARTPSS